MSRVVAALSLLLFAAAAAAAPPGFQALPRANGHAGGALRLKVDRYDGSTNGGMVVTVHNPTRAPQTFVAQGLYFVPDMAPEKAPQRLGAAGPFSVHRDGAWVSDEALELAPGASAELRLEVFCIDSHRGSPSAETPFRLAKKRLPPGISGPIEAGTKAILQGHNAKTARDAAGEVQEHVWATRNKAWIPVEGERVDERAPQKFDERIQQQRIYREPVGEDLKLEQEE